MRRVDRRCAWRCQRGNLAAAMRLVTAQMSAVCKTTRALSGGIDVLDVAHQVAVFGESLSVAADVGGDVVAQSVVVAQNGALGAALDGLAHLGGDRIGRWLWLRRREGFGGWLRQL